MRKLIVVGVCLLSVRLAAATAPELAAAGNAALMRGDADAAAAAYEKAVASDPNNARYHLMLGEAYGTLAQKASLFSKAGLAKKTKEEFERAVQLDPNLIDARMSLIDYYLFAPGFMGGSEEKALAQAGEIRKRDALDGHRAFARVYLHQKKPDVARKEVVDAVREQPKSAKAHYILGVFLMSNDKNWSGSLHEFDMALELDPKYMPAYFRIGQNAVNAETNYARAEESLRKYLAYTPAMDEPNLASAWYWLGRLQEKMGKKAEAKQSYGKALALAPDSAQVKEALQRVS
ncbi:MAG: tetratricopeptide repeat protein [Acidobacteria bacterium]|nr:tetratricopeptide repeat protein [Acidobacteriota bacterium]MBV9070649.1 tetratricopeptide repeat protein [Acidobacteriota bacterium]MBV9478164.1 tetratricopeptide repeat protein [Acidobacteriota bacterium]